MWTKQVTDMIIAGVGETLYMTLFSTFFWIMCLECPLESC